MTWSSTATRGLTGPRRPLRRLGGFGSLASSIPLGFSAGRPLSPFSRAISARWAATVRSRAATLLSNSRTSAFSSVGESASRSPGGAIPPGNQRQERRGSENRAAATSFAAGTFLGAAGTVTGSRYLLEGGDRRVLIDCGLFQGLKQLRLRNWAPFPILPETISAAILTHAHL